MCFWYFQKWFYLHILKSRNCWFKHYASEWTFLFYNKSFQFPRKSRWIKLAFLVRLDNSLRRFDNCVRKIYAKVFCMLGLLLHEQYRTCLGVMWFFYLELALVKIVKRRIKGLFIWMLVFRFKFLVNNVSPFWPGHYWSIQESCELCHVFFCRTLKYTIFIMIKLSVCEKNWRFYL